MPTITDAQVDVAWNAYQSVECQPRKDSFDAMRAALEAYERVRDLESIYTQTAEQRAENDARVEESLESLRYKVRKEYPL